MVGVAPSAFVSTWRIGCVAFCSSVNVASAAAIDASQESSSVNRASVPARCAYTRLSPTVPKQRLSSPASTAASAALNTFRLATFSAVSRRFASSDTRLSIP